MPGPRRALLCLVLLAPMAVPGSAPAEAPPALMLTAASRTQCYADPAAFQLSITFYNSGETSLLVLPALVRRAYHAESEDSATYVPHPGPPISPWQGAIALPPHGSRSVDFPGMRDGDGVWRLAAGQYRVVARYTVGPAVEALRPAELTLDPATPLWQGELRAEPVAVLYDPQLDAAREIDFGQPDPCVRRAVLRALARIERVRDARDYLEGQGFVCAFSETGFLIQTGALAGRHLGCMWERGGRVSLRWHVGVIVHGAQVVGAIAVPERIHM